MIELSAYSDWRCGAISTEERDQYMAWEARRDEYLYEQSLYEDEDYEEDDV